MTRVAETQNKNRITLKQGQAHKKQGQTHKNKDRHEKTNETQSTPKKYR